MEKVYADRGLRDSLAKSANEYAKTFSWDDAASKTLALLERTAGGEDAK